MLSTLLMLAQPAAMPMPHFLSGCWEQGHAGGRWSEECWSNSSGGAMFGLRRDGNGSSIERWEWSEIQRDADGSLFLRRSTNGEGWKLFQAVGSGSHSIIFVADGEESGDHPLRLRFERSGQLLDVSTMVGQSGKTYGRTYRRRIEEIPSNRPEGTGH